ncbi:MAG: serpin family protein [Planctomycetota bacterium]
MHNFFQYPLVALLLILGASQGCGQTESEEPRELSQQQQRVEPVTQEEPGAQEEPVMQEQPAVGAPPETQEQQATEDENVEEQATPDAADDMANVYLSERMFAMNMTAQVASSMPGENFVVSPFGVYECLNVLAVAANPEAGGQIAEAIGLTPNRSYATELAQIRQSHIPYVAPQQNQEGQQQTQTAALPLSPFISRNAMLYDSQFPIGESVIERVFAPFKINAIGLNWEDPASVEETGALMNRMFADATSGRMTDLVYEAPGLPAESASLVNLGFFGANWSTEFSELDPRYAPPMMFQVPTADGVEAVNVPYMQHSSLTAFYHENEAFQLVELPYLNSVMTMVLVLPAEGATELDVLRALVEDNCLGSRGDRPQQVVPTKVSIPKFAFETGDIDLNGICSQMGINGVFQAGCGLEDLFSHDKPMFVERFEQNAMIQVDEKGTVAAAVTEADLVWMGSTDAEKEFTANRPFMFFIADVNGGVYFSGRVANPVANQQVDE